ncbi:MAG: nucleoside hydrolase, partial [Syntrophomonadaceae bacterium]
LTNFAVALRKDPSIIPLIKEFRLMSGGRNLTFSEWNVFCDPEASYIVVNSQVPIVQIGIDTTHVTALSKADIAELKNSKSLAIQTVYEMMMDWFAHYNFAAPVMHDPLAVATILKPELCTYEMLPMNIELHQPRGFNIEDGRKDHLIKMATGVNVRAFLDYFKDIILK